MMIRFDAFHRGSLHSCYTGGLGFVASRLSLTSVGAGRCSHLATLTRFLQYLFKAVLYVCVFCTARHKPHTHWSDTHLYMRSGMQMFYATGYHVLNGARVTIHEPVGTICLLFMHPSVHVLQNPRWLNRWHATKLVESKRVKWLLFWWFNRDMAIPCHLWLEISLMLPTTFRTPRPLQQQ